MHPGDLRMLHAVWGQHWDRTGQRHMTWKNTFFINSLNIFPLFFKQLSSVGTILFSQLEGQQCPSTGFGRGVVQKIAGKINDKDQVIVISNSQKVWNTGLRPQKTLKLHSLLNKEPEFQYHLRLHNTSQIFFLSLRNVFQISSVSGPCQWYKYHKNSLSQKCSGKQFRCWQRLQCALATLGFYNVSASHW